MARPLRLAAAEVAVGEPAGRRCAAGKLGVGAGSGARLHADTPPTAGSLAPGSDVAPPVAESTVLSITLALLVLFAMSALVVGSVVVLVTLVRRFFAAPIPVPAEATTRAPTRPPSVAVGAAEVRPPVTALSNPEGNPAEEEPGRLALWRARQLMRFGVEPVTAVEAALCGIDAAGVRSLVARGCRPALAVTILLPDAPGPSRARSQPEAADRRNLRPRHRAEALDAPPRG